MRRPGLSSNSIARLSQSISTWRSEMRPCWLYTPWVYNYIITFVCLLFGYKCPFFCNSCLESCLLKTTVASWSWTEFSLKKKKTKWWYSWAFSKIYIFSRNQLPWVRLSATDRGKKEEHNVGICWQHEIYLIMQASSFVAHQDGISIWFEMVIKRKHFNVTLTLLFLCARAFFTRRIYKPLWL